MEPRRFDGLAISISRRTTRRAAVGALIGFGASRFASPARAATAICLNDGQRCGKSASRPCCSGWCKRKHGSQRKTCKSGPDRGVCNVANDYCTLTGAAACGDPACYCFLRPNGASVCASVFGIYPEMMCSFPGDTCTDKACRAALGDNGAFCVRNVNGPGCCADKMGACVLPCETLTG